MSDLLRDQLQAALGGAYTLERELGGGGMSRVFVARDESLRREVVVKVLMPELALGMMAERFAREVQLTARLQEPHIVPVLAAGTTADGLPYYLMPFVVGESLRARMTSAAPTSQGEAVSILRDVAKALAYAHRHGAVHRDVKPENVLLSDGTAVVTDFGIAKAVAAAATQPDGLHTGDRAGPAPGSTLTRTGTSIGTPAYMAPEQAAGDLVDHRTDIYAWGVMAYELLAGRHPFAGKTTGQQLLAAHIAETPLSLGAVRPDVPPALVELVTRSMAKDPAERPQTAGELVRALDAVAGRLPGGPDDQAATTLERAVATRGRRRRLAVGVAAVLALLALAAGTYALRRTPPPTTDAGVVAVLPFRVAAADPSLAYLREGMLDLLAAKLADRPRALDPRVVLAAWRRAGGDARVDPDPERVLSMAAALGAGRVLDGEVVGGASRMVLSARLLEAPGGRERARASVTGAGADLAILVDSLAARLLALDAGERASSASTLGGIPLPALQAYLAGQVAMREGEYQRAVDDYAKAVDADSAFVLAAIRLSLAAAWVFDPRSDAAYALAMRHRDRLGARDQWLLPDADRRRQPTTFADVVARQEAAVTAVPDMPELWYDLGDTYFHQGLLLGQPDADRRAARAFERALALDSTFRPAFEHLPVLYELLGDTAARRRSLALLLRDTTGDFWPVSRWMVATTAAERRPLEERLRRGPLSMQLIAAGLAPQFGDWTPEQAELLRSAAERAVTPAEQRQLAIVQYSVAMNRGQPTLGARAYDPSIAERFPCMVLDAVFWDGDSLAAAPRLAALAQVAATPAPTAAGRERRKWVQATFLVAQDAIARGDTTHTREAIRALLSLPPVDTVPLQTESPRRYALLLDAQLAARAHRPDAAGRLASLDSMLRLAPVEISVRAVGNLVAARLWEDQGDRARAYAALKRTDRGPHLTPFFSTYLRERARLAAALGDREAAIADYRRYLSARSEAEPSLLSDVERVRTELARLERESVGR
ncbi:MAG TPA: serine/threonine-protein kinase [Gemmatimonadaceae bacterium]|nr:serine/threonine-protein kinase [Gemmatimonadaceae bacterium]